MIIDSHHHLWKYSTEEYGWIDDSMSVIARDFVTEDLTTAAKSLGVVGSVAVQARQVVEETAALLAYADANDFLLGVVGWVPMVADDLDNTLDKFDGHAKLKGYRHVVQDEPDNDFILGEAFNRGVTKILKRDLVYDILIFERQLGPSIEFVDRHPGGRFVLDHIAKPRIAAGEIEPWKKNLTELALRENVTCKISGIVTEAEWATWSLDSIRPYLDSALEAFGPSRLMFGSDWPVCLLATEYERWLATMQEWAAPLSETEREALFSGTAIQAYNLEVN